ncbi:unnamed protein product [Arctogadus glacialis]
MSRRGQTRGGQPIRLNKSPDEPVGVAGACRPKPRPPPSAAQSQHGGARRGTADQRELSHALQRTFASQKVECFDFNRADWLNFYLVLP